MFTGSLGWLSYNINSHRRIILLEALVHNLIRVASVRLSPADERPRGRQLSWAFTSRHREDVCVGCQVNELYAGVEMPSITTS